MRVHQFGLTDFQAVTAGGAVSLLPGIGYASALPSV